LKPKNLTKKFVTVGVILSLFLHPDTIFSNARPDAVLGVGKFSSSPEGVAMPDGWEPLTFKKISRHTRYTLVMDAGRVVVKANSEASSSGLIRKIRIDPKEYPLIEWRWKVLNIYQKGDVTSKAGDDYPARLYITFESNPADMGLFEKVKYEDYKSAFGRKPPMISGVAIMTDSDNTGESTTAFYGDIIFKKNQ